MGIYDPTYVPPSATRMGDVGMLIQTADGGYKYVSSADPMPVIASMANNSKHYQGAHNSWYQPSEVEHENILV